MTVTSSTGPDRDALTGPGLATTDPDLVAIAEGFALGSVLGHGDLDPRVRHLTRCAALVAVGSVPAFRRAAGAALTAGVTPVELKEVVYQGAAYVGVARALDALDAANDLLAERGVELPLPSQSTTTGKTRAADGRGVQEEIVGAEHVAAMYAGAPDDEQHLQQWLSAHCFGDHYTRTGLDVPTRELVTLALLVGLGGADPQVRGHVAANLRVGNGRDVLLDVVSQLVPYVGYPRTLNAVAAIDAVAPATR